MNVVHVIGLMFLYILDSHNYEVREIKYQNNYMTFLVQRIYL